MSGRAGASAGGWMVGALLACALAGCSEPAAPADTKPPPGSVPAPATDATAGDAPRAGASRPAVGDAAIDALDLDFDGAATDYMRRHASQAPQGLRDAADAAFAATASELDCTPWREGDRAWQVDLDGDGSREGLSIRTLESCGGGGNNYVRLLSVLREDGGAWRPVLEATLGDKLSGNRAITRVDGGSLVLAGGDDAFDSSAPAETLRLPLPGAR